jgi:hypothetical protein
MNDAVDTDLIGDYIRHRGQFTGLNLLPVFFISDLALACNLCFEILINSLVSVPRS